ncbi:MAG TPA: ABC transporter permease, partial [Reyranella sp.]|nr:ABC transporter permease [Reyranella sp.]
MLAYAVRRLLLLVPMAAGMVVVTFALLLLVPGDPAHVLLGPEATPDMIANLRASLGLDNPWYVRLWDYFAHLLQGDMGRSIFQNAPVAQIIAGRLGATIELAIVALLLATLIGMTLGVVAAMRQGSFIDTATMLLAQLGVSM